MIKARVESFWKRYHKFAFVVNGSVARNAVCNQVGRRDERHLVPEELLAVAVLRREECLCEHFHPLRVTLKCGNPCQHSKNVCAHRLCQRTES